MKNPIIKNLDFIATELLFAIPDVKKVGGATYDFNCHKFTTFEGYFVSLRYPNLTNKVDEVTFLDIRNFLVSLQTSKTLQKNSFIGLWIEDGYLYLDSTLHVGDLDSAIQIGKRHNQKAIFDCKNQNCINL